MRIGGGGADVKYLAFIQWSMTFQRRGYEHVGCLVCANPYNDLKRVTLIGLRQLYPNKN